MTLRLRLLLALVGLVATALVVSDVVTYTQLQSFLLVRVDQQLDAAGFALSWQLLPPADNVPPRSPSPSSSVPGSVPVGITGVGSFTAAATGSTTPDRNRFREPPGVRNVLLPPGTFGEVRTAAGKVTAKIDFAYEGPDTVVPALPAHLPKSSGSAFFTITTTGTDAGTYRVTIRPESDGDTLVVGVPLSEVDSTLDRLRLVAGAVTLAVLSLLAALAWWTVRRGLRPLERMAATAGAIASGDLSQRVEPAGGSTEVGRLGLALNTMLEEIEEAFVARAASEDRLRRFLADASHELRTPLTSIQGYAELFELGGTTNRPEDLATSLRHVREEANRMSVLVDDLLLLARLDHQRPLGSAPVDLAEVIAASVRASQVRAREQVIDVDAPPGLVIEGDVDRLRQVVDNLLANTLSHTPEGTDVHVRLSEEEGWVLLEVEDRGPGVSASEAARIFEPFHRSDPSRTRSTGGAGLGLAIVEGIVRLHAGEVGVRPGAEGRGSCFWVRLPKPDPVDPRSTPTDRPDPEGAPDATPASPGDGPTSAQEASAER